MTGRDLVTEAISLGPLTALVRLTGVELVLGRRQPLTGQHFDRSAAASTARPRLRLSKRGSAPTARGRRRFLAAGWLADADADPEELVRAQPGPDRAQAVVTGQAASRLDPAPRRRGRSSSSWTTTQPCPCRRRCNASTRRATERPDSFMKVCGKARTRRFPSSLHLGDQGQLLARAQPLAVALGQ